MYRRRTIHFNVKKYIQVHSLLNLIDGKKSDLRFQQYPLGQGSTGGPVMLRWQEMGGPRTWRAAIPNIQLIP